MKSINKDNLKIKLNKKYEKSLKVTYRESHKSDEEWIKPLDNMIPNNFHDKACKEKIKVSYNFN